MKKEALKELKALFRADGIELTDAQALQAGLWLIERVRAIAKPIPPEHKQRYDKILKETGHYWSELEKNDKIITLSKMYARSRFHKINDTPIPKKIHR